MVPMRTLTTAWRAYLTIGLLLAVVAVLFDPDTAMSRMMYLAVAASGPFAIALGLRRHRQPTAWSLLLLGVALMVTGDALWIWYETLGVDPFPSLADALYLPGYPVVAAALFVMLRSRRAGSEREGLIDATIIATGSGVLSWVFLIAPYVRDAELTLAERLVSAAYPLMGILLVAVVARLGFARRNARTCDVLLAVGLVALLIADTVLGVVELTVGYDWNPIAEFLWLAMYVLFGAAALISDPSPAEDGVTDARSLTARSRLQVMTLASLMAPGVLVWFAFRDRSVDLFVIAAGSAMLFLLVLARIFELVRKVEEQAAEVTLLATADPLTGLANRRHWVSEIQRLLAAAQRGGGPVCVAMLDLDHFKPFNDLHGHYAGDTLLRATADAWREELRTVDVLARMGGDEFALALPDCCVGRAMEVVERLREVTPNRHSFSAGLAAWGGESDEELMIRADMALYAAKSAGRARTVAAEGTADAVQR